MGWLTPRLGDFFRAHPEVGLRVSGEFHALDRERMARDDVAAALRYDLGRYGDLQATPILDEWLLPVASPAFMAAHPQLRTPADLSAPLLLHDSSAWAGAGPYEEWTQWLDAAGVAVPAAVQSTGRPSRRACRSKASAGPALLEVGEGRFGMGKDAVNRCRDGERPKRPAQSIYIARVISFTGG
jgi:DNA-binding transcriptional LysR family regulator